MKKWGFFSIIFLFNFTVKAQQISGVVRDLASGRTLAQVVVLNENAQPVATTDSMGYFRFNVPEKSPKNYSFQLPGYLQAKYPLQPADFAWRISLIPESYHLEAAQVKGIRAETDAPTTFVNLTKKDIKEQDFSKDFPYLLQLTPSVVVFSDAGTGIGYTGMRIRGVDQTRINVTINGVPVNDAESQGVFWVDLPDIASSTESVQIQRGIGSSSNGPSAFGGSINVKTDHLSKTPFSLVNLGYGSFNTFRGTVQMGTGELSNGWNMSGRLSFIRSDGFIDRSTADLNSWYLSSTKKMGKGQLKMNVFSGHERTYQAWNGVPQPKYRQDTAETERYINQLYLPASDAEHLRRSDPERYNAYTYKNQVDDYRQTYYQLFYQHQFRPNVHLNSGLYYTRGFGFYEEYKPEQSQMAYGLNPLQIDSATIDNTDLIRRRWLDNHLVGALYNLSYQASKWTFSAGGTLQQYVGFHFGQIIWAQYAAGIAPEHRYYHNRAQKREWSQYVKANVRFQKLKWHGDLQLRGITYDFVGPDRNLNPTDRTASFLFFNPKTGITYDLGKWDNLYVSAGMAGREPVRDDFINSGPDSEPKAERMINAEGGYRFIQPGRQLTINGYLMYYKDQLVLAGKINDVGAYNRINIPKSYRAGIETAFGFKLTEEFIWSGSLAWSTNKIVAFTEYLDDWTNGGEQVKIEHRNTDLAFSPTWVGSSDLGYVPFKGFMAHWTVPFMSRQYLDNTSNLAQSLDPCVVHNLSIQYEIPEKIRKNHFKKLLISCAVNNLLDRAYAPNGYTFSALIDGNREVFNYVYPQAGRHYMLKIVAEF